MKFQEHIKLFWWAIIFETLFEKILNILYTTAAESRWKHAVPVLSDQHMAANLNYPVAHQLFLVN